MDDNLDPERFMKDAYRRLFRQGWGAYDEAIVHPEHSPLIEQYAVALERQARILEKKKQAKQSPQKRPQHAVVVPRHQLTPIHLDRKQLAAGEREDDE